MKPKTTHIYEQKVNCEVKNMVVVLPACYRKCPSTIRPPLQSFNTSLGIADQEARLLPFYKNKK